MATKLLYLVSAVLVLATGIYVAVAFTSVLSVNVRFCFGLATVLYFLIQFGRYVFSPLQRTVLSPDADNGGQFSS